MLTDRYASLILGVFSCFDRILLTGTLPDICHAGAFTRELNRRHVRIFDYSRFAAPLRDAIRDNAERLARENGLAIEHIRRIKAFRKEDRVQQILAERGTHPGLVHIFSAMETCASFKPWHDKGSGKTFLRPDSGKCLHYYFYFIDPDLGLCHLRVPTWAPFRLQFCMNGHNWLASRLKRLKVGYRLVDNAFVQIDDFARAQQIADRLKPATLHRKLDRYARQFCPAAAEFTAGYHWSIMQVEYATDIVFRRREDLAPLYDHLIRTAVHTVRADHVATFLGRKLDPRYQGEVGNDFASSPGSCTPATADIWSSSPASTTTAPGAGTSKASPTLSVTRGAATAVSTSSMPATVSCSSPSPEASSTCGASRSAISARYSVT